MDFILIYPPSYLKEPGLPIGGLYLAESLLRNGYTVQIINDCTYEEIFAQLKKYANDSTVAIGISVASILTLKDALYISKSLKDIYPNIPIIWGGQYILVQPTEILQSSLVDFICLAEGENVILQLLGAIKKGGPFNNIKGIGYKDGQKHIITDMADYTSLKGCFKLPYHLINMPDYYRKLGIGGERWLGVLYSRGCPYRCSFCINSTLKGINSHMRYNDIEHAIYDIKRLLLDYNVDGITIYDDHFLLKEDRVVNFCEKVISENIKLKFRASARIDALDRLSDDSFRLLRKTGFLSFNVGIESGSPKILSLLNKNITLEQVYSVDEKLSKYGFYKSWNFINAFPNETIEDLKLTLQLIAHLARTCLDSPVPFRFRKYAPLPKTKLFEWVVERFNWDVPETLEEWSDFSQRFVDEGERGDIDLTLRPWMTKELAEYMIEGGALVESLNLLYTGKDANRQKIESQIKKLERFPELTNAVKSRFIGNL